MPHCDPDTLALGALGEPVPADDAAHLASCPACQSTLDQLRAVVFSARQVDATDIPAAPPSHTWTAIADELELSDRTPPGTTGTGGIRAIVEAPTALPTRRRRANAPRRLVLVAAAAAVVGLLAGAVATSVTLSNHNRGDVLATTQLEPVDNGNAHGTATLRSTSDGRVLDVDLRGLPASGSYYEVWFMNAETGGAVSLGSLGPQQETTFAVPAGLTLEAFPYVDVSLEPLDGNPEHSSDSVARGRLGA